jgi:HSP20 family protein
MAEKPQPNKMQKQNATDTQDDRSSRSGGLQPSRRYGTSNELWQPFSSPFWMASPFEMMRRFNDEVDRWFSGGSPRFGQFEGGWAPNVEVFHRGNELVIRADLPGVNKNDVEVEIGDNQLAIRGERKQERHEEREGYYRSERSYGTFHRTIPLPEGTIADSAKASFDKGVLEISVQAPPREVSRGRRVEISDASQQTAGAGRQDRQG